MRVDKVERIVYNEPIILHRVNAPKEVDASNLPRKTPMEIYGYTYNNKAQIGPQIKLLDTYA